MNGDEPVIGPKRAREVEYAERLAQGESPESIVSTPSDIQKAALAASGARFDNGLSEEARKRYVARLSKMLRERK